MKNLPHYLRYHKQRSFLKSITVRERILIANQLKKYLPYHFHFYKKVSIRLVCYLSLSLSPSWKIEDLPLPHPQVRWFAGSIYNLNKLQKFCTKFRRTWRLDERLDTYLSRGSNLKVLNGFKPTILSGIELEFSFVAWGSQTINKQLTVLRRTR